MEIKIKSIIYGTFAVIVVLLLNLFVLSLLGFPTMAMEVIKKYWILIALLLGGFGLQIGLFIYFRHLNTITCSTTVVSGGTSAISMILCCSHYLLNLLPFLGAIIGISALTALSSYTLYFLLLGIFSNILGIGIILYQSKNKNGK